MMRSAPVNTGVSWCRNGSHRCMLSHFGPWSAIYPNMLRTPSRRKVSSVRSMSFLGTVMPEGCVERMSRNRRSNTVLRRGWYMSPTRRSGGSAMPTHESHSQLQ